MFLGLILHQQLDKKSELLKKSDTQSELLNFWKKSEIRKWNLLFWNFLKVLISEKWQTSQNFQTTRIWLRCTETQNHRNSDIPDIYLRNFRPPGCLSDMQKIRHSRYPLRTFRLPEFLSDMQKIRTTEHQTFQISISELSDHQNFSQIYRNLEPQKIRSPETQTYRPSDILRIPRPPETLILSSPGLLWVKVQTNSRSRGWGWKGRGWPRPGITLGAWETNWVQRQRSSIDPLCRFWSDRRSRDQE